MNYINITVRGKIARAEGRARVVCGNSDYAVRFDFDAEWKAYDLKTARFVSEDGSYTDVQFEGSDCAVPILRNTRTLLVGVFAGNLRTTTAALIHAVPCITDPDGTPADPTPDVYAQLMERFNAIEAPAAVLYTAQELTDAQKATARSNIGVATPDWNQKDETASDYIKNRPFYEVTTDTLFDLTIENWRSLAIGLGTNVCSWRVAGVDYIDVMPTSQEGGAVQLYELGNVTVVVLNGQSRIYSTPSDADVHLLMRKSVVKQIDPKFIPANRFTVTVTENGNGGFTADKTIAEIIEAYEAEKDVVASFAGQELPLHMISNGNTAVFDLSTLGDTSQGLTINRAGVNLTNKLIIPKIYPVEKTSAMTSPVGVDIDGKLWSTTGTVLPTPYSTDRGKTLSVVQTGDDEWGYVLSQANTLGMYGAKVGQIAKIKNVNSNSQPVEWEAVDMPSGGGGDLSWIEVVDITTAEQTQKLTISVDKDGRPISQYNALWMVFSILFPADATQTSANGAPWIYPFPKTGESAYRYIATVSGWKTIERTLTYAWAGLPRIPWSSAMAGQTIFGVNDPDFLSGLCVYLPSSSDHIPAGTRVRIAVLSKGVTA